LEGRAKSQEFLMACRRSKCLAVQAPCIALVILFPALVLPGTARAADTLYDVAKVSVDATDKDAVAAKAKGMKAAELDALEVVLKRLMPTSAYAQLPDLSQQNIEDLVSSVSIRSERNSATRYIASLDVSFNPEAVKQLLDAQNLPYSEARAEPISILPLVLDGGAVKSEGPEGWYQAWDGLDLTHSVTPATILKPRPDLTAETVKSVLGGDAEAFALMQADYSYAPLVIAVGEAGAGGKFTTRLIGADGVGPINYGHTDNFGGTARQAAQQAAAVAFGIIENRWKVTQTPAVAAPAEPGAEPGGEQTQAPEAGATAEVPRNVQAVVQFSGLKDWQEIRTRLMQVAGIQALEVNALSARAASITFDYAGSLGKLQAALDQNGFAFDEKDGGFVLRSK
ncbi:DUF2066 domain-containing protein, partial [Methyloceanibacter sp.]|uniref:DUF2066 domain-containing protein n=2 Tax=Methyloceanibacter sp. TaxID=1965321 RepID=UPI002D283726